MKKSTRIVSLMSVMSLLGGLLVSCSGGSNSVNSGSTGTITRGTIYFWHCSGQSIQTALEDKADDFEELIKENEGVDVNIVIQSQGGDYVALRDKVNKSFAAGNTPTITVAYPDHVADYIEQGRTRGEFVANLADYIDNEEYGLGTEEFLGDTLDETDIVPAFLEEGTKYVIDGTYSLPFMKSTEVMFYNRNMVTEVFQKYRPDIIGDNIDKYLSTMSWEDLMDISEYIVDNKANFAFGQNMLVPTVYDSDANMFVSQMMQMNIPFSSIVDGKGQLDFNNDQAKAMVQDLKDDYDKGLFTTKGAYGEYGSNLFTEGECVFSIGSSGGTGYNAPQSGAFEVGVVKVPARNDNPLYVTQGMTLALLQGSNYSASENEFLTKYGWKFMKYITNTQNNVDLCLASEGYVPVRESSYETEDYQLYLEDAELLAESAKVVINDISGHYLSTATFKGSATLRTECAGLVTSYLRGNEKDINKVFDTAENNTRLQMGGSN